MTTIDSLVAGADLASVDTFEVVDPSTGLTLANVGRGSGAEVDAAVDAARVASYQWRRTAPADRSRLLRRVSGLISRDLDELALLESKDTGKPLSQARADATVSARYFEFYANVLDAFFGFVIPTGSDLSASVTRVPFGVTGHIIPWNYPMQIASRTIAPALAAGNCCVLKPAEDAPLTVDRIARLALEAGLPDGVLNVVHGLGHEAGAHLAAHPGIDHLSFTGSVEVGRLVARAAADNVKPTALELGGKSPNIVLGDADLDHAVPIITKSIVQNAGQTCSAGSRLVVHRSVHSEIVDRLGERLLALRLGPGPDDPDLGPLISKTQLDRVGSIVGAGPAPTVSATVPPGLAESAGFYFPAMLFDDVDPDSVLAQEEVFGPVVAVIAFDTLDEAIAIANNSRYGLIAAVWTDDLDSAHRVADRVEAGQVYVNTYGAGGGVEFPFGGFKQSGYGREKGFEALSAFSHAKTTIVKHRS